MSEGRPEPRLRRWNEIKVSVFTVGVTITISRRLHSSS